MCSPGVFCCSFSWAEVAALTSSLRPGGQSQGCLGVPSSVSLSDWSLGAKESHKPRRGLAIENPDGSLEP